MVPDDLTCGVDVFKGGAAAAAVNVFWAAGEAVFFCFFCERFRGGVDYCQTVCKALLY